mgnify:CR=1 FL=1
MIQAIDSEQVSSEARKIIGEGRQKAIGNRYKGLRLIYFYIHSYVFLRLLTYSSQNSNNL